MPHYNGKDSVQRILPRMGDHSGANIPAPISQNSEHGSVQADQNHHPKALICVSQSEYGRRKKNASRGALSQGHELPL
jgi:hypothetical protein